MSGISKRQRPRLLIGIFVGAALVMASCESSCKKTSDQGGTLSDAAKNLKSEVVAVVNGVNLLKSELDALHQRASLQLEKRAADDRRPEQENSRRHAQKMIDDELVKQRAEKEGVKVDRFERVKALEQYKD